MRASTQRVMIVALAASCCWATAAWAFGGDDSVTMGEAMMLKSYGSPLTIAPSALRNIGPNPQAMILIGNTGALQAQDEVVYAMAPVYLPDGATITSFHAAVFDGWNGPAGACSDVVGLDVGVWLMRVENYTGEAQQMSFIKSSGSDTQNQWLYDASVEYPFVEQPEWSYYLLVRMCKSAHLFKAAHVLYTMP